MPVLNEGTDRVSGYFLPGHLVLLPLASRDPQMVGKEWEDRQSSPHHISLVGQARRPYRSTLPARRNSGGYTRRRSGKRAFLGRGLHQFDQVPKSAPRTSRYGSIYDEPMEWCQFNQLVCQPCPRNRSKKLTSTTVTLLSFCKSIWDSRSICL